MSEISFLKIAIRAKALCFGDYKLKSGRISPYFFDASLLYNGKNWNQLSHCYAEKIIQQKIQFEILFGPAYKGIPLVSAISAVLFNKYDYEVDFCYNRKERKEHGERGILVGRDFAHKKVLIVDDVITAGTAISQTIELVQAHGAVIVGAIVALDRQEIASQSKLSAIQLIEEKYGVPFFSISTLEKLITFVQNKDNFHPKLLQSIRNYRALNGTGV